MLSFIKSFLLKICVCSFFTLAHHVAFAQADTTKTIIITENTDDSVRMRSYADRFDPQRALLLAAVLPGSGQVYNKKYWKVPLVYGGFAFFGFYINSYNNSYSKYKVELFDVINSGNRTGASGFTEGQLRTVIDRYRRERDFFIIMAGLWYLLQITDAHVDAHLKEFDVNPNLKVRLEPKLTNDVWTGTQGGLALTFRFNP
ncbi:MAG: DUF5683 domain-containing protein [Cyclobacteriaceae bacterium]|jgi:hypothetical protein|nr:DUF5683 domain-containing protein [Cytophagales bacterium]MCZ8327633.1 DUF5683 domain-containing protein [Cyclobacteriaceae bacterium]